MVDALRCLRCFLALLLFATVVVAGAPALAVQQNEILLSVSADGTEPFDDDPADPGDGSAHTPGLDESESNGVVRTHDQIKYRIDWAINEEAASSSTVRMTLPPGLTWIENPATANRLPTGCESGSIAGQGGRDLVCELGAQDEGSNGVLRPRALVGALFDGDRSMLQRASRPTRVQRW